MLALLYGVGVIALMYWLPPSPDLLIWLFVLNAPWAAILVDERQRRLATAEILENLEAEFRNMNHRGAKRTPESGDLGHCEQ
ncbi:hypothetical protein E4T66_20265 [Sinimarinibacterium sp. CAU 1509]|uniref:hypothetical protein n=1 Tax=Sinimarinibacterium sp. CAU 1509 TaxID=2562283 RepID=UPI0010AD716F|nr:hypothetical protein [Sinimarinibacterium sp. CAU 1509]TJY55926.1 hypothetical protein E4T66_20265 [Sinimarinibacterium sp. CAU 1509]